jgi:hypothetical protein
MTIASSAIVSTVDFGSLGPVGKSVTELRFFHLVTVFGLMNEGRQGSCPR